jgi:hypothetical protein
MVLTAIDNETLPKIGDVKLVNVADIPPNCKLYFDSPDARLDEWQGPKAGEPKSSDT